MAYTFAYETGSSVFGQKMPSEWLIERIGSFDWRGSLIRLSHLAAIVGNDDDGPRSQRACRLTTEGIGSLTASTEPSRRLLKKAAAYLRDKKGGVVVAHEESISFLQHLVILHGSDVISDTPSDAELALWLLGAGDHLDAWLEPDARHLTSREELVAATVRAHRFNRSGDALSMIVRTSRIFESPPVYGTLAGDQWDRLQYEAFGGTYGDYFDDFLMLLFVLSLAWGQEGHPRELPLLPPEWWTTNLGKEGGLFVRRLRELTATRRELAQEIRKRMRPGELLPHAPTALLHRPMVDLGEHGILATSPWNLRALLVGGVWAKYRAAAKKLINRGDQGGFAWTEAFGLLFEGWLGEVARMAETEPEFAGQLLLPDHPGAKNEIEDVVVVENGGAVLFSAKGRMVKESVARHAKSRSELIDWYEDYFFAARSKEFRGGALRQLHDRIDMIRDGAFEPDLPRNAKLYPTLVTFDTLCENPILNRWVAERCAAEGILHQEGVGPVTLAEVCEYESLMAHAASGGSIADLLSERADRWRNRRLGVQLFAAGCPNCVPEMTRIFTERKDRMLHRFGAALGVDPNQHE